MPANQLPEWTRPLWHRKFAQDVDAICQTDFHMDASALMETAGRYLGQVVVEEWRELETSSPVIILCGPGNNGGDGMVAARYLHGQGVPVFCILCAEDTLQLSRLCSRQRATLTALGLESHPFKPGLIRDQVQPGNWLCIDAIWGIGYQPPRRGDGMALAALTEAFELQPATVVAADIPSGIAVDYFQQPDPCPLPATVTVTFGDLKPAQIMSPSRDACGFLEIADIGFPAGSLISAAAGEPLQLLYADSDRILLDDPFAQLDESAHKYDRGHILVLGGSPGKCGAPALTALSALRTGAGWATLATPEPGTKVPLDVTTEVLWQPSGAIDVQRMMTFMQSRRVKSVVIGPGTMSSPLTVDLLESLAEWGGFCLFDAGALHGMADILSGIKRAPREGAWLATPHPGEWSKMGFMQKTINHLEDLAKAHQEARTLGITVLYKSATPLTFGACVEIPVANDAGSNQLGKAGTGDVLCGIIAAHGALRSDALFAANRGYCELARICEIVSDRVGKHGMVASDLV